MASGRKRQNSVLKDTRGLRAADGKVGEISLKSEQCSIIDDVDQVVGWFFFLGGGEKEKLAKPTGQKMDGEGFGPSVETM